VACRKNKSKGQVFFGWANSIDRNHGDVSCGGERYDAATRVLPLVVMCCRTNKSKGQACFVWTNRIDRRRGDGGCGVGYCDDVSILGSGRQMAVLTSATKGNCR